MSNLVCAARTSAFNYEPKAVRSAIIEAIEPLGGLGAFVSAGQRVLIKPNLLTTVGAGEVAITNPRFIVEAARLVADLGAKPTVGDSPAFGGAAAVIRKAGIAKELKSLGVPVLDLGSGPKREFEASAGDYRVTLSGPALDFDVILNLPKLKLHCQMGVTAAVKNLFGVVPGKRKAVWHWREQVEVDFAAMLLAVLEHVAPALTIIDGIVGMEGYGPRKGPPRELGVVLAGANPLALDSAVCEIIGFPAADVPYLALAAERGLAGARFSEVELRGLSAAELPLAVFDRVAHVPIGFSITRIMKSGLKTAAMKTRDALLPASGNRA